MPGIKGGATSSGIPPAAGDNGTEETACPSNSVVQLHSCSAQHACWHWVRPPCAKGPKSFSAQLLRVGDTTSDFTSATAAEVAVLRTSPWECPLGRMPCMSFLLSPRFCPFRLCFGHFLIPRQLLGQSAVGRSFPGSEGAQASQLESLRCY